jgi:hypothetical protein
MKLSQAVLFASAQAAWPDKFAKQKENEARAGLRSDESATACSSALTEKTDENPIENGFWDCPALGQDVDTMKCTAKCTSGEKNWKKADISAKCKTPPKIKQKISGVPNGESLKCAEVENPCDALVETTEITMGSLVETSSNAKEHRYDLICDDGENLGTVKCSIKTGEFKSKLDFETACDRFVCDEADAFEEYPIGAGEWDCKEKKGKLNCKAVCAWEESLPVRYQISCDSNNGWRIKKNDDFKSDMCEVRIIFERSF